jgi:ribonuclease G
VFDYTEALTVIDVNTAKFARGSNHEETVFRANLEAAGEVARQIRLRNIGGIIVVDFIDMIDEEHKEAVVEELRRQLLFDRTKTRVIGMSSLGLVEITRKKVGKELSTVLLDKCPYCDGDAHAHSFDYVARKVKAALKRLFASDPSAVAIVTVNPMLMDAMFKGKYFTADCETIWRDKRIYLVPEAHILNREFTVKGVSSDFVQLPPSAKLLY